MCTELFQEQYKSIKESLIKEKLEYNLYKDILKCKNLIKKCKENESFAQHLYAALCNNKFIKKFKKNRLDFFAKEIPWSCSWRQSAYIVSYISKKNIIDFYCSGLQIWREDKFVEEGFITKEIEEYLKNIGWHAFHTK